MIRRFAIFPLFVLTFLCFLSCGEEREHTAAAIYDRDSVPMMTTYGVNTLISDSGVIKYRIVTERWEINDKKHPSRWIFDKGVLLTQFDQTMHIQSFIQGDTAYYYDQDRRWELHGRVRIHTKQGMDFRSEELYWDEMNHEIWSHRYSHLKTPERELEGNYFRSDEKMTKYIVTNTRGSFEKADMGFDKPNPRDSMRQAQKADSTRAKATEQKDNKSTKSLTPEKSTNAIAEKAKRTTPVKTKQQIIKKK